MLHRHFFFWKMPEKRTHRTLNKSARRVMELLYPEICKETEHPELLLGYTCIHPLYRFVLLLWDSKSDELLERRTEQTQIRVLIETLRLKADETEDRKRQSPDTNPKCRCGNTPRRISMSTGRDNIWKRPICRDCRRYPYTCQNLQCTHPGLHEFEALAYRLSGASYHRDCIPLCDCCKVRITKCKYNYKNTKNCLGI